MRRRRLRRALGACLAFDCSRLTTVGSRPIVLVLLALSLGSANDAAADCIVVRERTPIHSPHVAVHFGAGDAVPQATQCATKLDRSQSTFCVPIWVYNLYDGASEFELSVSLPATPIAFEADPAISDAVMTVAPGTHGTVAGLHLRSASPLCGPQRLGCLLLATSELPDEFAITIDGHPETSRRAARDPRGVWRSLVVDAGGARVGEGAACPRGPCSAETPVHDLAAEPGSQPGMIDLDWQSGSGTYTLLCARTDGRFPNDPWDGQLLALLPADIEQFSYRFLESGTVHFAAWSVTRGPFGSLHATSTMECGALVSARVDLPVGVSARAWGQVKTLFR